MKIKDIELFNISRFRAEHMGMAMLFVILFHVALPRSDEFFGLRRMGNLGVDIFLFLSGIGLWYSWVKKAPPVAPPRPSVGAPPQPSPVGRELKLMEFAPPSLQGRVGVGLLLYLRFYLRRLIRVYPAWLVIACLYYIPRYHGGMELWNNGHGLIDLAGDILINWDFWLHDELTFWYIPATMMLYLFAPPYMELIRRHPIYRWLVVVMIMWSVLVHWVTPIHNAVGHLEIFWSRVPIFFLGLNMGEMVRRKDTLDGQSIWMIWIMFIMTLGTSIWLEQQIHGRFPLFIERMLYIPLTVTTVLLMNRLFRRTPKWFNTLIAWFGALSLEAYLIHMNFVLRPIESYHLGYWPTFLLTVAITMPLAWLLHVTINKVIKTLTQ